jgi:hypothetical protein
MVDAIIDYIRMAKTGVSSVELAERFLKFKNPPLKFAQTAISGIIAGDGRCLLNADDLWVFDESRGESEIVLNKLPLCIVYIHTDSNRENVDYISVWDVLPCPEFCCDILLYNPLVAVPGVDQPGIIFDKNNIETRLAQVVSMVSEKFPVLLSNEDVHLFNAQFENDVFTDKNRVLLFDNLLEALSIDIPDNYSLSQVSKLFNVTQLPESLPEQAKLFATLVCDVLKMLNENKIFTKKELDHAMMLTTEQMIAGKLFSLQQIQSLPAASGVYGLKDNAGKYLFISKCKDLQQSVRNHFRKFSDSTKKRIAEETVCFDAHHCGSELECEFFEYRLIKKYNPRFYNDKPIKLSDLPGNCILVLPHSEESKVLTVWVCAKRNIIMKSFRRDSEILSTIEAELANYFFTSPDSDQSDPYERGIVGSFLRKNPDFQLLMVPSSITVSELINAFKVRIKKYAEN